MDVAAMSSGGSVTSESTVLDSEEDDRAFIEISELDKLLGLPPPRFDLGAADIDPRVLESADNCNSFDPEIEFALPQKPLPRRVELGRQSGSETEVSYDKDLSTVSVVSVGSDGRQEQTTAEGYMSELGPGPLTVQDEMLYKRSKPRGKTGVLNRVVSKLLAKGDPSDDSILQTLLLESAPVPAPAPASVCDTPPPTIPHLAIPPPVIDLLKKLGTSVEPEQPLLNGGTSVGSEAQSPAPAPAYLQIMESLDKAVGLTSDLTKKKQRKSSNNQVPSNLKLLLEMDNSDSMTKFSFQVDAKQVIELPEGQKLYTCDICSGVYHRGFSLKRHYLKTHINHKHISKRDLHNCGILLDPSIEKGASRKKQLIKEDSPPVVSNLSPPNDIPDLYRCHTCGKCFMVIHDLKTHLMEHPPVSVQNLNEDQYKNYTCPKCKARYQKKKLFLRHKEMCGQEPEPEDTAIHYCLYCEKNFPTFILKKKHHLQMHHPKKKLHQCYLCKTKMFKERLGVFKHLLLHHPDEYIGCLSCKLRFGTREEYKKHNKENHKPLGTTKKLLIQQQITAKSQAEEECIEVPEPVEVEKVVENNSNPNLMLKCTECPKMFACYLNMTRHRRIAHRLKKQKKVLKKSITGDKVIEHRKTPTPPPPVLTPAVTPTPPPPTDPEVLFYSTISHNIRENLTHHLDGKLDSQEVMEYDLNKSSPSENRSKVLNFSAGASFSPSPPSQPEATSTPVPKEPRATPISPRAPWEKFNFPKNYDGRCGLTSYIKDMSHLDISTQLTMRRNLQRLNSTAGQESGQGQAPASIPAGLLLVEKPLPDCAEAFGEPDQTKDKEGGSEVVLSGEWVRPRVFLCSVCGFRSKCLWETEDHKYVQHPNVWVPHVEIVGDQDSSAWDWFYYRRLPPGTEVVVTTPAPPPVPPPCTKCERQCGNTPDLHLHLLECGGDTSWQSLVGTSGGRRRKWRPFGSRRRKHQGRRGLKRNIPNTPAKHSCGRIRTKPGDMDTIQKMIANLPAKRARRAIGEDLEIKTRSQATISSVPISSLATHSSAARHSAIKASKVGRPSSKMNNQKKIKVEHVSPEEKVKNKDTVKIKEEPVDNVSVKEENIEREPLEAENTIQHSDILTSLQMIRVVRTSTEELETETEKEKPSEEEPIETSKIIAAMREAMLESEEKVENRTPKPSEKRKKSKVDHIKIEPGCEAKKSNNDTGSDLIICNGCGMQFDNASACQRHKKKCVYWKEDKSMEESKTNKCTHCGCVFPYLMALLKHNCRLDAAEEPPMPELCPEQPVEEVQGDTVEDIPILSPVDISRDRRSLVEATVSQVSDESFDITPYFQKFFKSSVPKDGSTPIQQKIDQYSKKNDVSKKKESLKNTSKTPEVDSQLLAKKVQSAPEVKDSHENVETPKAMPLTKSPGSKDSPRNKKVSEIFKETKRRRGRKRHKIKVKLTNKVLENKVRNSLSLKSTCNLMKRRLDKRKRRTSNFLMLMKEFEKLQKEGAVAIGKRKRICSNSEVSFRPVRSRRRMASFITKADYADDDSIISDLSEIQDFLSSSQGASENNSMTSSENMEGNFAMESEKYCKEINSSTVKSTGNSTDVKGEPSSVVQKRKPGRPPRQKIISDCNQTVSRNTIDLSNNQSKQNFDVQSIHGQTNSVRSSIEFLSSEKSLMIPPEKIKKETPTPEKDSQIVQVKTQQSTDKDKPSNDLSKAIKVEPSSEVRKRKPGRPPLHKTIIDNNHAVNNHVDVRGNLEKLTDKQNCLDVTNVSIIGQVKVEKEEVSTQQLVQLQENKISKRKPGRPRFKSMTEETEQHINEAIDIIVKRTMECNISPISEKSHSRENSIFERKIFEGDKTYLPSPEITKPAPSALEEDILCKQETDEHIQEAIESVLSQTQDAIAISREVDWTKIEDIIYNVSVGSAEVFGESNDDVPCSAAPDSNEAVVKKRRRKRKKIFTKFLKKSQKPAIKSTFEEKSLICNISHQNELPTEQINENVSEAKTTTPADPSRNDESGSSKITNQTADAISPGLNKKAVKTNKGEPNNVKPKEVKTKQLSIEDYLTISHFVKVSSVSASNDKMITHENKSQENNSLSNDLKETGKKVNVSSGTIAEKEVMKNKQIEIPRTHEINKKDHKSLPHQKQDKKEKPSDVLKTAGELVKPLSPCSTSSKEDVALSVIKDKAIKKRKKRCKLKKLLKKIEIVDVVDSKLSKITKPKIAFREDRNIFKDKLSKKRKKIKVGVSRNRWEVSVVKNKNNPVELVCEEESKAAQPTQSTGGEPAKKFYCSVCDLKFESSYNLYEHQLTAEHNLKSTVVAVNQSNLSEEKDPVKYCKSIGNIINDLEKRTLNVAKVMQQLKPDGGREPGPVVESTSSPPAKEEWALGGEWWEGAPLEGAPSLGSLMVDTVNKLLSSDQELMAEPPYSLSDLQLAMGASDDEMAMLFQLGEHTLQEEYVYDSSRPAEEGPTLMDLDHQTAPSPSVASTDALLEVRKQEPVSDSEDSKPGPCRGAVGKMLGDYENREMVCPTCNKHFLGLPALQTHVAWSHCAPVTNTARLKRRALLSSEDVDRRLVCFVCKEIVPSTSQLDAHIQAQHTKKADVSLEVAKPKLSEAAEKLKSKMSLALGGLVDRALNKLLGTGRALGETTAGQSQPTQAELNSGALQLLGRLCAARKRVGNDNLKLSAETLQLLGRLRAVSHKEDCPTVIRPYNHLTEEMKAILARGGRGGVTKGALAASVHSGGGGGSELKPTNLLDHLAVCSSDVQERPYACPICDLRFLIPSTRNRHIARAHGKYGRRYDEEVESPPPNEEQDHDWKIPIDTEDANDDGEMLPVCSDCGLSFQSIHEVMRHRIEDHPRRFSADFQEDEKPIITNKIAVVESTSEIKDNSQIPKNYVKLLPVSDNAIDSTSTVKKKRGRPAKLPEYKSAKRKCLEQEKKCSPKSKCSRISGRKKTQSNDNDDEQRDSEYISEAESSYESSREESSNMESNSPETDKSSDKLSDKHASRTSSEENLAELSRKLDRRKVRMGNMAEEAVRVKAEAALRELNLAKKQKAPSSAAKWGINAVKFTKSSSTGISSSQLNGSPTKPRFASLSEKKKIHSGSSVEQLTPKTEVVDVKPDIYDFRDEELETNRRPFPHLKESHLPESVVPDSNKLNTLNVTGSPRKASRLNTDNS